MEIVISRIQISYSQLGMWLCVSKAVIFQKNKNYITIIVIIIIVVEVMIGVIVQK